LIFEELHIHNKNGRPNNTTSARDISSEWNADIYSSLKRLELYEKISVDGFPQLIDYVTSLCVDRNPGAVLVRAKTQAISSFNFRVLYFVAKC